MLKFVKQGESGRGLGEEWSRKCKDGEHDCSVCRTRRRSLDRQAAGVLRRSRSRETLRSIGNTSSNEDDTCVRKMSPDDKAKQLGGGAARVWCAKGDKYRRLSRSCEALSTSCNGAPRRQNDTVDDIAPTKDAGLSRGRDDVTVRTAACQSMGRNGRMPCAQTVPRECQTRQLGVRESRYTHDQRWHCPMDEAKTERGRGPLSAGKQVQFGGVEYEKPKEESVIEKLRNAVGGHRRKMRSRSLERVDRQCEWNPEIRHSRSSSWARDDWITHPGVCERERRSDQTNYEQERLSENCKRRSRSRSRECVDRDERSETRRGNGVVYRYDDNRNIILNTAASWQHETVAKSRSSSSTPRNPSSDAALRCDLQYKSPSRTDHHRTASWESQRTSQGRVKSCTLISPQYKAPNGHYGNAVVRKCHKEPKQDKVSTGTKSLKLECASRLDVAVMSRDQASKQTTRLHGRDNAHRSSSPKLEKCGISATKIAKLDTPLKMMTPDSSVINKIVAPTISILSSRDAASTAQQNAETISAISSSAERPDHARPTTDDESRSLGYVYNCTTSKITKLNHPETSPNAQRTSKLVPQSQTGIHISCNESLPPSPRKSDQVFRPKETRKPEAANTLVRQASVASLSLISVNSVDSGTSCHEGSTTDSSSSSSDKEMETHNKTSKRLGREARQYTASARELENVILASCFGKDKHVAGLVTSDYESDTGPEMVRNQTTQDGKRRGGMSRVVRFVGSKDDVDVNPEMKRNQQSKQKGQAHNLSKKSTANIRQHNPSQSISNHLLAKLTVRASVLHNHKAMSKAEMSVQKGDVVHMTPEDFEQRPLWVRAYSSCSGETGLIPSVYLGTN